MGIYRYYYYNPLDPSNKIDQDPDDTPRLCLTKCIYENSVPWPDTIKNQKIITTIITKDKGTPDQWMENMTKEERGKV